MSALRERLKQPQTYLAAMLVLIALAALDSTRAAEKQWTAHGYLAAVGVYQRNVSPELAGGVRCRFTPTCSRYSAEAVRRYGIREGLVLTAKRLWRCRDGVKFGTEDPVPGGDSAHSHVARGKPAIGD